ncbi:histidinol-phosphate aminotransferase [Legionella lansingensis]|uniref:histidinol-phosphate transaminase n=1 Tax=Legionella lansingensis TaxID=45067 RepID=A0A0W0VGP9_9GAMM|nr:histidinol-phosphate transaminase [Legionella lansingensis]KTD19326.1 histidinol-phosphate aminotransferase (imidazole acetol-phosphate transaminase) [Legionella lansingensis]SNV50390.1 histidinol-phosphate aminotransferase [Legionella lansingensis]
MSVLDLIRPDLKIINPYIPTGDDLGCRLHANELPWSPVTMENVCLNHYPNGRAQQELQMLMAAHYQIKSEEMVLTRGSDDGIDLIMRVFLRAGIDSVLQCPPTFPMYAFYAHLQQAKIINCPLIVENNFSLAMDQLIVAWQPNCKLIILCQPNNPTGNMLELVMIAELCEYFRNKAVIVVDEAYIDFAEAPSATTLLSSFDNLIILRTLSKAYGMAGLRLGAVIGRAQVIEALKNAMAPYTLSSAVIQLAKTALISKDWFTTNVQRILTARADIMRQLKESPWIEHIFPTRTNFILVKSPYAHSLMQHFANQDIAVRYFAHEPLKNMMRITVGNESQNRQLLNALAAFTPD